MRKRVFIENKLPHIGMRIIKSAFGVLLCFAIYLLRGKEGTPFYSALAVLWCIQNQTRNTIGNALQRTVGTGIGAAYGLFYILLKLKVLNLGDGFWHFFTISLLIIPIIYTTVLLKQKKASYFSCVVFLSIVVNHLTDDNPYLFVLNRTLDTLIGIFVGLILNSIHIHGRYDKESLFVVCLDGAMDGFFSKLTPYSQVSIKNMLEDGINLVFMTERTPASFLEGMPDIRPKLPIIAMNGAILYDACENRFPMAYIISAKHACDIESFIEGRGFNVFSTVILDDVLIIYYRELLNQAEKNIYDKLHKSPYRNYLNRERPKDYPVAYMMCIDETEKIDSLVKELESSDISQELKLISYPDDEYPGYSYLKIYNKNASVRNMIDYLKLQTGTDKEITISDNARMAADLHISECNQIIRKIHNMYYWAPK